MAVEAKHINNKKENIDFFINIVFYLIIFLFEEEKPPNDFKLWCNLEKNVDLGRLFLEKRSCKRFFEA
jgi:hypothetical protein